MNFFVQMKWVFKSTASFKTAAPKYAVLAVAIVVVNLVPPGHVTEFCQGSLGMNAQLAGTIASVVNTVLAVVVSFPILKFWITPSPQAPRASSIPRAASSCSRLTCPGATTISERP